MSGADQTDEFIQRHDGHSRCRSLGGTAWLMVRWCDALGHAHWTTLRAMADPSFALVPASYVYLLRGDDVLLQQRQNTGYMDGYWVAGAAGHVDPGETARQAA